MNKIVLKKIVKHNNKSVVVLFMTGIFVLFYFLSSVLYFGTPGYFLLTKMDHFVPFLPWTSVIYILMYPLLFAVFFELKSEDNQNLLLYALAFLLMISSSIFIFYPVSFPREFYPLPPINTIGVNLLRAIRYIDRPLNCFPSLHVSSVFLFSFSLWNESKLKFGVAVFFSFLIAISTMTTKQHYFLDVIAGFFLASAIYICVWRFAKISSK